MTFLDYLPIYAPISVAAVLLLLGGWIARKGWRRRKGTEPHCRKCDYLLLAIQSDRCPECGSSLNKPGVILGERTRSWRTIIAGCIVLIIALAPIYALTPSAKRAAAEFNWYHYRPTAWVMDDLRNGAGKPPPAHIKIVDADLAINDGTSMPDLAQVAMEEMRRRDERGGLNEQYRNQLFDLSLAAEGKHYSYWSPRYDLFGYASDRVLTGDATPAQKARFFQPAFQLQLEFQSPVKDGQNIRIGFQPSQWQTGDIFWGVDVRYRSIDVDGQEAEPLRSFPRDGIADGGPFQEIAGPPPGQHKVNVTVMASARHGFIIGQTAVLKFSAPLEVIASSPPRVIRRTPDTDLANKLASNLHPMAFQARHNSPSKPDGILGTIWMFEPSPVNLAFDVFARYGGHEYPIGRFIARAKSGGIGAEVHSALGKPPPTPPATVDIVLRTNPRVAMSVPDMNDIWDGEIVLHDVPVEKSN